MGRWVIIRVLHESNGKEIVRALVWDLETRMAQLEVPLWAGGSGFFLSHRPFLV